MNLPQIIDRILRRLDRRPLEDADRQDVEKEIRTWNPTPREYVEGDE